MSALTILNSLKRTDVTLLAAVVALMLMGLLTIFSTSYSFAETDFLNFKKQALFSIIGILLMISATLFDYRMLKDYTGILYIAICLILATVLLFGYSIRGTTGWFNLGLFNFQPSEFAKTAMIIILAKYFSKASYSSDLKKIIISVIYTFFPAVLIASQPDLGTCSVIVFVWFAMLVVCGTKKRYIAIILLLGALAFGLSWTYVLKEYQRDRIIAFVNPSLHPYSSGYNVIQSVVAIGSGKIWGKGLGHGSQSQLNFLPEKHTDFIFAVIAEEMGFIGLSIIFLLFGIIFYRLFRILDEARDNFGKLLTLGTLFMLIFHIAVNIGMNMAIMPVTGIPLPFVSYGGSSLLSLLILVGIVQNVYIRGKEHKLEKDNYD